jgi:hypothetical protein
MTLEKNLELMKTLDDSRSSQDFMILQKTARKGLH